MNQLLYLLTIISISTQLIWLWLKVFKLKEQLTAMKYNVDKIIEYHYNSGECILCEKDDK